MSNFASGYVKYINHLEQINDAAVSCPQRMIAEVEDAYHDHLENIARNITSHHRQVRVIMLSGPSSSAKTRPAWRLSAPAGGCLGVSIRLFAQRKHPSAPAQQAPSRWWITTRLQESASLNRRAIASLSDTGSPMLRVKTSASF